MSSVILKGFGDGHSQSPAKEMAQEKLSEAKAAFPPTHTLRKEATKTSFPNERRTAREKYLYFPMQEIELYCTCLMPETNLITCVIIEFDSQLLYYHALHIICYFFSCKDYLRVKVKVSLVDNIRLHTVSGRTQSASC